MAKKHEIDMTTGPIPKKVLQFALPLMLSSLLQVLFHSADTIIVGRFAGSEAMAAVGSNGALIALLTNLFAGISVGSNVLCARYRGSRDDKNLSACMHSSVLIGAILGLFVSAVGFVFSIPMLTIMSTDESVLPLASLYLKIYFLGVPASMLYNFIGAILRALGDTARPMKIITLAGVVNVVLNLLFVVVLHMDVAGVALATVISQYLSLFFVLRCLMKADASYRLSWKHLRLDGRQCLDIIRIGLPSGLNSTVFNVANVTIQSAINSLGALAMAANAAASSVDAVIFATTTAYFLAATPFTSQNFGAGKYDRIPKVFTSCLVLTTVSALTLSGIVRLFGSSLLGLYVPVDDPHRAEVIADGLVRLTWVALPICLCCMMDIACGVMRGLGKSWLPFVISVLGTCVVRVAWIKLIFPLAPSLQRLYFCFPLSWVITFFITLAFLLPMLRKLKQKAPAAT